MSDDMIITEAAYNDYTVYELKDELKEKGLKVSGNKNVLIARLLADVNNTIEAVENVIEQTEEAVEAVDKAVDEVGDVTDKLAEKDIKGALTELKDASDEIQIAAEESMEAAEDALDAAEEVAGKASALVKRWKSLSNPQKIIVSLVSGLVLAFVISGYQF